MPWFKVDDGLFSSRKVLSIPRKDRVAAVGLWTLAGSWAAQELTDGVVPKYALDELGATLRLSRALVEAQLWLSRPDGGIEFKNWSEFQPTRSQVEADRSKTAERQARWREKHKAETGESHVSNAVINGDVTRLVTRESQDPDPTRPDPLIEDSEEGVVGSAERAPSPFCSKHMPMGPNGHRCGACGDAKRAWEAAGKPAVAKLTPSPAGRRDPATCKHSAARRIGSTFCGACDTKIDGRVA